MSENNVSRGDVHYTVHNHCQRMSPLVEYDGHLPSSQTWVGDESTWADLASLPCLRSGRIVPDFEFDAQPASQEVPQWPLFHRDRIVMNLDLGSNQSIPHEHEHEHGPEALLEDSFDHCIRASSGGHFYFHPAQGVCINDPSGPGPTASDVIHQWNIHTSPDVGPCAESALHSLFRGHDNEGRHPVHRNMPGSGSATSGRCVRGAASALCEYNKRWDYINGTHQPCLAQLPWPKIRSEGSFDDIKYDVFSFFAKGCGLQPDDAKAPRLNFKLSARRPHSSCDRRQQEGEKRMLKAFREQMKREKRHWHPDRLGLKFPVVMDMDDDSGKAVWAAIVEGSAICERRLRKMH